ncbi:hypothetical protein ACIQWA_06840 [Kitasatospora sp. NPDC098652]|uniref:hypothetical protein n=1 Tax=Kitasatospora sp. NPDC098652 TaxID=3364095 RepID=UPI003813C716
MKAAEKGTKMLKSGIKHLLGRAGFDIVRSTNNRGGVDDFLPFEATMGAARAAGLSLSDYIDEVMNGTPGATQSTIDELRGLGAFAANPKTVLEIGPGSGRYLEKTLKECSPVRYEIYETAALWADYLVDTFKVVAQPTAECSLASTPDGSVDLVQAHKGGPPGQGDSRLHGGRRPSPCRAAPAPTSGPENADRAEESSQIERCSRPTASTPRREVTRHRTS